MADAEPNAAFQAQLASAYSTLANLDHDWQRLLQQVGACTLQPKPQAPYQALIRAVTYQQLHGKAADAIYGRMLALFEHSFPSPAQLLNVDAQQLRQCGLSANKILSIQGIAQASLDGQVPDLSQAEELSDAELIAQLTRLRGIGRWTVEMMLIFNLGRLDVLPVDDLAVRAGFQRLKQIDHITPQQLSKIGQSWSPYSSIAAWYLWRVPKG